MLTSRRLELRRSEIRQSLAELAANDNLTDEQRSKMGELDGEYRTLEQRYRAALVAEDDERREAGADLETREAGEWEALAASFELRQAAMMLDTGHVPTGATAEVVQELRSRGGYQGVPIPLEALETRAGETVAADVPAPRVTAPIIDRLFAESVATRMGARMINIGTGEAEYPVTTGGAEPGWAGGELAPVPGPQVYAVASRTLKPDHTLGVQMKISRKAMLQAGTGLEAAIRRDMTAAIRTETDRATFLGTGASGEPLGVITGASTYGITETSVGAAATYAAFRAAAVRFMTSNAAAGLGGINLLLRPELFDGMDANLLTGTAVSEWDRLVAKLGNVVLGTNGIAAPAGSPKASKALLTTTTAGVSPIFVGLWGAIDLIRDPFTDAKSGQLRLTALTTMDVTVARPAQLEVLTGLQ